MCSWHHSQMKWTVVFTCTAFNSRRKKHRPLVRTPIVQCVSAGSILRKTVDFGVIKNHLAFVLLSITTSTPSIEGEIKLWLCDACRN